MASLSPLSWQLSILTKLPAGLHHAAPRAAAGQACAGPCSPEPPCARVLCAKVVYWWFWGDHPQKCWILPCRCLCAAGFEGPSCHAISDPCKEHSCENGGSCVPGATNYTCLCPAHYTGNWCGSRLAPRPHHPISGTCPVFFWGLRLSPEAWSHVGTRLGTPRHPLSAPQGISASSHQISARPSSAPASTAPRASPPARGPGEPWPASGFILGGLQLAGWWGAPGRDARESQQGWGCPRCECVPGYVGSNCSEDFDDCQDHQCQNNARCVDEVNGYSCLCTEGYRYCRGGIGGVTAQEGPALATTASQPCPRGVVPRAGLGTFTSPWCCWQGGWGPRGGASTPWGGG